MIYFIHDTVSNAVKIGYSADPEQRLRQLQTACPHKLTLWATLEGNADREAMLHKLFAESRLEGEWFKVTAAMSAILRPLMTGEMDFEETEDGQIRLRVNPKTVKEPLPLPPEILALWWFKATVESPVGPRSDSVFFITDGPPPDVEAVVEGFGDGSWIPGSIHLERIQRWRTNTQRSSYGMFVDHLRSGLSMAWLDVVGRLLYANSCQYPDAQVTDAATPDSESPF